MTAPLGLSIFIFLTPVMVFGLLFRKSWKDQDLLYAALAGGFCGALSTIPLKYFVYPLIGQMLGLDLRSVIAAADSFRMKALACLGVVGPVEETAKLLALIVGVFSLGLQTRPAAIFLSAVAVGLGFSLMENLDYFSLYGIEVLAIRGVVSSTGHAVFAGVLGLAAAGALPDTQNRETKKPGRSFFLLMAGLALASIFHGTFNLVAFGMSATTSISSLLIVLISGVALVREFWTRILILDSPDQPNHWYCSICQTSGFGLNRFCPICGVRVAKKDHE